MSSVFQQKQKLRKEFRQIRKQIKYLDKKLASREIARRFMELIPINSGDRFGAYHPIKDEVDTLLLMEILQEQNYQCLLPRIPEKEGPLRYHKFESGDKLEKDKRFKIREPLSSAPEIRPTIIIVPMLAFDRRGYRLGYGGGWFDRTLEEFRKRGHIVAVGLAYSMQELDNLPISGYDQPMDFIVTEKELIVGKE